MKDITPEYLDKVVEENFNQLKISSDNHLAINAPEQIAYCDALDDALPIVVKFLHQELQKARQDWLRGEIVKLDGMRIKESHIGIGGLYTAQVQMEVNEALQTIIDRYHSELNQDNK